MKFSASILPLLLSPLVAADGLSFRFGSTQKALGDGEAVPGNNPLKFCKKDHDDDLLVLEKVNLTPNPPVKYVFAPRVIASLSYLSIYPSYASVANRGR
jgi:hypothetical protein